MNQVQLDFETQRSVQDCASAFQQAVKASYGGARKLLRGVSALRGSGSQGGVEFFEPTDTPFSVLGSQPSWKAGAFVPGYNKLHGSTKVAVHIYVVDQGEIRAVQLVGPYSMGEKGSTERLVNKIAEHIR